MYKLKYIVIIFFMTNFLNFSIARSEEKFLNVGDLRIWCETFGEKTNPALLLIMGGGCQGIMWPTELCERLAKENFYVIRYDHRDMGLSSPVDYKKNPYDLMDLSKDAIGILDALEIQKADCVGISMGGLITTLLGCYYPDRISSIVPIAITSDFSTYLDPSENNPSPLPKPNKECLKYLSYFVERIDQIETKEEKISLYVRGWEILNGSKISFDKDLYGDLIAQSMERMRYAQGYNNQNAAMGASLEQLKEVLPLIKVPTHIIHGTEDPFFSIEHGEALAKAIPGSRLTILQGMGHIINPYFYDDLINIIKANAGHH